MDDFFRPNEEISYSSSFSITLIGMSLNAVMPGRVGEIARVGLAVKKFKTGITFTAATIFAERMLDGITLLTLLILSFFIMPIIDVGQSISVYGFNLSSEMLMAYIKKSGYVLLVLMVLFFASMVKRLRKVIVGIVSALFLFKEIPARWIEEFSSKFAKGFSALNKPVMFFKLILSSVVVWLAMVLAFFFTSLGMDVVNITFHKQFLLRQLL